ncbi:MAG: HEAT repeat domain-containing protein [Candidatus Riflebacteria bacterium]|nr:HEAT repeat domain-containing protein [Candidatus Riflebacteria bacterium]
MLNSGKNPGAAPSGPEQKILADLEAPLKSFRLFALEQAISHGRSPELAAALERLQAQEQDEECLCLIPYALEAVRSRLAPVLPVASTPVSAGPAGRGEGLLDRLRRGDVRERIGILLRLTPPQKAELLPWAMETLPKETDPAFLSQMIRVFGKVWPVDRLNLLLGLVASPFTGIRCGAIEAVAARDPRRLAEHLPRLLADEDPRVVAEAIKALAGFDPEEARVYLDAGLRCPDPLRRQAMLRAAVLLPFTITRGPLLNLLAVARDPDLIEKAGLIIKVNPDPDVPFRILELMTRADASRAALLQGIFTGTCQAIRDSEILGDGFPAYLTRIKEAVGRRVAAQQRAAAAAPDAGSGPPPASPPATTPGGLPPAAPAAPAAPASSAAPTEKIQVAAGTAFPPSAPPSGDPRTFDEHRFFGRPPEDQCRWFDSLQAVEGAPDATTALRAALAGDRADKRVKEAALRAATRLGVGEFIEPARHWVQGTDEGLVTAALDYLGTMAPEKVLPLLGRFQASPHLRIQLAALRVLAAHEPEQAVALATAILKNPNPRLRASAVSALLTFDFPLIREPLTDFLESSRDPGLLESVLLLFKNNPDPENLFLLYRLQRSFAGESAAQVEAVATETTSQIEELQLVQPGQLEALVASFPTRWQEAQARKAAPPVYARKRPVPGRPGAAPAAAPAFTPAALFPAGRDPSAYREPVLLGVIIGLVVYGLLWALVLRDGTPRESPREQATTGEPGVPFEVEATVTDLFPDLDEIEITTTDQRVFRLLRNYETRRLPVGERIRAVIRPFQQPDRVTARFISAKRIRAEMPPGGQPPRKD